MGMKSLFSPFDPGAYKTGGFKSATVTKTPAATPTQPPPVDETCPPGFHFDKTLNQCVKDDVQGSVGIPPVKAKF